AIMFNRFILEFCRQLIDLHSFPTRRSSDLTPFGSLTRLPSTRQYLSNCTKRIESHPSDLRLKRGISGRNWISVPSASLKNLGFRSEEHTSELQSREKLVCRLLLEKKKEQIM